jgi:hypothetical protein
LVSAPALLGFVGMGLSFLKIQIPFISLFSIIFSFGSLIPPMLGGFVPHPLRMILGFAMIFLALRRVWLYVVKNERTPTSFVGFPKVLGYVGFWSFSLGVLVLLLSIAIKAGSGVPAGMLMIPAFICIPWAFFLTEVSSFRLKVIKK